MDRPIELVIFDCDGVLVDSERIAVLIDAMLLAELGWPLSEEEVVERFVGRWMRSHTPVGCRRLNSSPENGPSCSTICESYRRSFATRCRPAES